MESLVLAREVLILRKSKLAERPFSLEDIKVAIIFTTPWPRCFYRRPVTRVLATIKDDLVSVFKNSTQMGKLHKEQSPSLYVKFLRSLAELTFQAIATSVW